MTVEKLSDPLPPDTAGRLNQATIIGSARLAALWRSLGGRERFWCATSGSRIVAVLASMEFGTWPVKRLQIMPDGLYARPVAISSDSDLHSVMGDMLAAIAQEGYARVFINDFCALCGSPARFDVSDGLTTVVDISASDWQPPDPKIRSEIRKAEREGIVPSAFNADHDMALFLDLMTRTEERHGRAPKYPAEFWQGLAALARDDGRVEWVNVIHDGRMAASHIYFVEDDMLLHWQSYFDKEFSFLKPNQLLMYSTARKWAARGVKLLNQGASPPVAEGLADYKAKWGGVERRYRCLQYRSGLGRWL